VLDEVGRIARLQRLLEAPPSSSRAARGGSATRRRRTISRASAKVVGSAANGRSTPPPGLLAARRRGPGRAPAAHRPRAAPRQAPALESGQVRADAVHLLDGRAAPTSASLTARTSSRSSGGRAPRPAPNRRRTPAGARRPARPAKPPLRVAPDPRAATLVRSGWPPSMSTPPPGAGRHREGERLQGLAQRAARAASISAAAFPSPSVTSRPPGAGCGAWPEAHASRTRRSAESASTTARTGAISSARRSIVPLPYTAGLSPPA